jgi:hypothetical protein
MASRGVYGMDGSIMWSIVCLACALKLQRSLQICSTNEYWRANQLHVDTLDGRGSETTPSSRNQSHAVKRVPHQQSMIHHISAVRVRQIWGALGEWAEIWLLPASLSPSIEIKIARKHLEPLKHNFELTLLCFQLQLFSWLQEVKHPVTEKIHVRVISTTACVADY